MTKIHSNNQQINKTLDHLFSLIKNQNEKINQVKKSQPDLSIENNNQVKKLEQYRGVPSFYNYLKTGSGNGPFLELSDGSVKYDMINGIGINLLGYSHPVYIQSHLQSALKDCAICGNLLPDSSYLSFCDQILANVNQSRLKHFWFATSGSLANDNALKIIWSKTHPKTRLIAFEKTFAGRTIAGQNITWNKKYKQNLPNLIDVDYVPGPSNSNEDAQITILALEKLIEKNKNVYSAILIELIQGEAGFIFGNSQFYRKVMFWAKQRGIFIWVDEIQTFARTTELFAFQMFNLDDLVDIVTIGKALQVCGTFYTHELNPKAGVLGGTFAASYSSLLVANLALNFLLNSNIYGKNGLIQEIHSHFIDNLTRLQKKYGKEIIPYFGGIGLMISFEVGDSSYELTWKFLTKLFDNGVIAFSAGQEPARIRFLPSLMTTLSHIKEVFDIIEQTISETIVKD